MTASGGVGARWCCGDNEVRGVLQGSLQHNYEQWSNCSYGECLSVCKERAQYYQLAGQIGSVPYGKEVQYVRYTRFETFLRNSMSRDLKHNLILWGHLINEMIRNIFGRSVSSRRRIPRRSQHSASDRMRIVDYSSTPKIPDPPQPPLNNR